MADMTRDEFWGFNTQPPEGGWFFSSITTPQDIVSTRSRPKAAGAEGRFAHPLRFGFNTQPPEGGWTAN